MTRVVASPLAERNKSLQWVQRMAMARQSFRREDIFDAAALLVELAVVGSGRRRLVQAGRQTRRPGAFSFSRSRSAS